MVGRGVAGRDVGRAVGGRGAGVPEGSENVASGRTAGRTAPEVDPTAKLTEVGDADIEPVGGAAEASNETTFRATNADGEEVDVVVDTTTGAVVSEQEPAEAEEEM